MKNLVIKIFGLILLIGLAVIGCTKDKGIAVGGENELPTRVVNLVSIEIIRNMEELGMPINVGEKPPNIEGTYHIGLCALLNSSIAGDVEGCIFDDFEIVFHNQNTENLSIKIDYLCGLDKLEGVDAFIVGNNNKFTVFAKITLHEDYSAAAYICALSGEVSPQGILDTHISHFMVDDGGDPLNCHIENGKGRVLFDRDGFSEKK